MTYPRVMFGGRPRNTDPTNPEKGAYNGFSDLERGLAATWANGRSDIRPRRVPDGTPCAICTNVGGQIGWHSEDYAATLDPFAVCAWCHWALHSRFRPTNVWPAWTRLLAAGLTPPLCPWGTRWATYGARYARRDPNDWDWIDRGAPDGVELSPLARLLSYKYTMEPPIGLRTSQGDPHLPGQWNSGGVFVPQEVWSRVRQHGLTPRGAVV